MAKTKIIAVVGPTGSGKSDLAVKLAQELDGEVISCDSMQVYRQMDIGTAKITEAEKAGIPHFLLDEFDYDEPYNVQIFQQRCREAIADIASRNKAVILCGGTGLYLKAALYDYVFEAEEFDEEYTAYLNTLSDEALYTLLQQQDPESTSKIHPHNRKRIIRALQIAHTGVSKSQREKMQKHEPLYNMHLIGLDVDRTILAQRIDQRVERMAAAGLAAEVERLFADPASWEYTSFQGIGYKEFKEYFTGHQSVAEVLEQIKVHSRQYAKRQMTWFKNQMPVIWYPYNDQARIIAQTKDWFYGTGKTAD